MGNRQARLGAGGAAWALSLVLLSLSLAPARAETSPEYPDTFVLHITLRDEANLTSVVVIGESESASSGYDIGLDVAAPPSPPGGSWLQGVSNPPAQSPYLSRLQTDMRPLAMSQAWNISLAAGRPTAATVEWSAVEVGEILPTFIVTLSHNGTPTDMRESETLAITLDGTSRLSLIVERGAPPQPPTDVRAAPDLTPIGGTRVMWTPPGVGTVATGYDVFRQNQSRETHFVTHVEGTSLFVDRDPALGEIVRYIVVSTNIYGRSTASVVTSNSTTLGTGLPHQFRAPDPENDTVLAVQGAEIPAQSFETPAVRETLVTISREDEQHATISFVTPSTGGSPGEFENHTLTVLDAGLLPEVAPDVPGRNVESPSGSAALVLAMGQCPTDCLAGPPILRAAFTVNDTRLVDSGVQPGVSV